MKGKINNITFCLYLLRWFYLINWLCSFKKFILFVLNGLDKYVVIWFILLVVVMI